MQPEQAQAIYFAGQEAVVASSDLDWTLTRPVSLRDVEPTGDFQDGPVTAMDRITLKIGLTDFARFTLDQLDSDGDQSGDACDSDDDNDGLSDSTEAALGTDPLISDTDTDDLSDGDEHNIHATDPLLLDTDGDGAGDGVEIAYGTDPLDIASFPLIPDGDLDADGNVDVRDVLIGYRSLMGEVTLSPFLSARGDVAPLVGGLPVGDGEFNLGDVLVIQRKALGLVPF